MNLKQLEYFLAVADLGSFTKAALLTHVEQPALSRQVRLLEVELGQHLFYRNGRGVALTDAGKLLQGHGRGIVAQTERLREALDAMKGKPVGKVVIGLPPSVAKTLTGVLAHTFYEKHPQANLSIVEGLSLNMMQGVQDGRIDFAVVYNPDARLGLDIHPLGYEQRYLISAKGGLDAQNLLAQPKTVELAALASLPLIIPSRPNSLRMLVDTHMAALGLKPNIKMEIDGVATILTLVAQGYGHAVLGSNALPSSLHETTLCQRLIINPELISSVAIVCASGRASTQLARLCQILVADLVRQHVLH